MQVARVVKEALIEFLPGVRHAPPEEQYCAPIKARGGLWSLWCERQGEARDEGWTWDAEVEFLVPSAPHEVLKPGFKFELLEGPTVVARGRVR